MIDTLYGDLYDWLTSLWLFDLWGIKGKPEGILSLQASYCEILVGIVAGRVSLAITQRMLVILTDFDNWNFRIFVLIYAYYVGMWNVYSIFLFFALTC